MSTAVATPFRLCDLDTKYFTALVTGLIKRQFGRDDTIDHAYIKAQIFSASKMPAEVNALLADIERTLQMAAVEDWTVDALQTHLTSMDITPQHLEVFKNVWKNERAKIHASLVSKSVWSGSFGAPESSATTAGAAAIAAAHAANPSLPAAAPSGGVSWRIDVKAQSKAAKHLNEPTAIVELAYHKEGCATGAVAALTPEVVRFEMDRSAVNDVLTKLTAIEALVTKLG